MTEHPRELRYTIEHEWVRVEDDGTATIGVTFFAQDQLGDVVYVVLPAVGATVQKDSKMGEIESVKSVSDLFVPVSGEVIETNQDVIDHPERGERGPARSGVDGARPHVRPLGSGRAAHQRAVRQRDSGVGCRRR